MLANIKIHYSVLFKTVHINKLWELLNITNNITNIIFIIIIIIIIIFFFK